MSAWLVWLIIVAALGIGEMLTLTFVLAMFAGGATAAAIVAAIGGNGPAQGVAFGVVSLFGLWLVLPIARRHRHGPALKTGAAAIVGKRGRTLTAVSTGSGGRVIIGGEEWSAAPYDESVVIPADSWVDVLAIDGARAVIHPIDFPITR